MGKPQRSECVGCVFEGKAYRCAGIDLEWAWYNLKKALVESFSFCKILSMPKEPDPCDLRELKEEMEREHE